MSTESLKTAEVPSVEGVSAPEAAPNRFIWEDLLNAPSERLRFLDRLKDPSFDKQTVARLRDMVLDMGQRKEVDFDTFRDLLSSIGIEVELLEDLVTEKRETVEDVSTPEASPVVETASKQNAVVPDVLGAPRPEPVFGEEISKKAVVQEPVVETTAVTPTEVTEETQTPPVDEMVSGGETFDVTREDVRAMIDASYAHLSPEDREKIYEAAIKELGL